MTPVSDVHTWVPLSVRQKAPQRTKWMCSYGCGARLETEGLPDGWGFGA